MAENSSEDTLTGAGAWIFRLALFGAAASLAAYIPYKYVTELHAFTGMYAFLFPLSALLAVAGMLLAVRPALGSKCGVGVRSATGALAVLWMATGVMCAKTLTLAIIENPGAGSFAAFHMLVQHVVLSLGLLAFVFRPQDMATWLGAVADDASLDLPAANKVQSAPRGLR